MTPLSQYDYIIAGMGCAGLSLAVQLSRSGIPFKKILLVDKEIKNQNDRSWCFWTKEKMDWYEPAVYRTWDKFLFSAPGFEKVLRLKPYSYKFIRGIDFYNYCLQELAKDSRFDIIHSEITDIVCENNKAYLKCSNGIYSAAYLFNSAFRKQNIKPGQLNYVQHFLGWLLETDSPCFDKDCPTIMDFNTDQDNDFRFFYVIPYSSNKALIEYTGFSHSHLNEEEYELKLKTYMHHRFPKTAYTVLEKEKGLIPMSESAFVNPFGERVINIGTAGGQNKISTGYAFYFIQKHCAVLIEQIRSASFPLKAPEKTNRFTFYDKVLLQVLDSQKGEGREVFRRLFEKNKTSRLLDFLNEESDIYNELRIFLTVDKSVFVPAAIKKILY